MKIRAFGPITSQQIGKRWKQWQIFLFLGFKITADGDCSHEIRVICSLAGKLWQPRQCIEKQRHYSADNVRIVKAVVFPVVTDGCESWTVRKITHQRIDAFELWCWRRFLKVPWTARSNQSILREINPEYSLEGQMLKLQYFGHLMQTADSLGKSLMLGKIEGRKRRG